MKILRFNNKRGMSLISVLVSLALSGMVVSGFLQVNAMTTRSQAFLNAKSELSNFMDIMKILLSDEDTCLSGLEDKVFNSDPNSLDVEKVSEIEITNPNMPSRVLAGVGIKITPVLEIKDITLEDFMQIGADQYFAKLQFGAKLSKHMVFNKRTIPLKLETEMLNNGTQDVKIVNCVASSGSSTSNNDSSGMSLEGISELKFTTAQQSRIDVYNDIRCDNGDRLYKITHCERGIMALPGTHTARGNILDINTHVGLRSNGEGHRTDAYLAIRDPSTADLEVEELLARGLLLKVGRVAGDGVRTQVSRESVVNVVPGTTYNFEVVVLSIDNGRKRGGLSRLDRPRIVIKDYSSP